MQKWLDLLTPSAAALALLLVLALMFQAIRHGRAVRRLESRLADEEGAAARVSLDRLQELQRRSKTSSVPPREAAGRSGPSRMPAIAAVVTVLGLVGATTWYVVFRDTDASSSSATTESTPTTDTGAAPTPVTPGPTEIPATPEALPSSRAAYTILVLNATSVVGAAGDRVSPKVREKGWNTARAGNVTGVNDLKESFVVYLTGKEVIADNLAKDLGIKTKQPRDGITVEQDTSSVDAIVIVGQDLADRYAP